MPDTQPVVFSREKTLVLSNARYQLFKEPCKIGGYDGIVFELREKKGDKSLLAMNCITPNIGENFLVIDSVVSKAKGGLLHFRNLLRMARTDLRKKNRKADIVSSYPTSRMKRFYTKRLGARKVDGVYQFPKNLSKPAARQKREPAKSPKKRTLRK